MRLPAVRLRRAIPAADGEDGERHGRRRRWRGRAPWRRRLTRIVRHNVGLKVVSLLLACFLWYSINELERDAERLVELPVAIRKVPAGLIVTDLSPEKGVTVTLRGPRTILDSVDEQKTRLVVDLSGAKEGKVNVDLNRAVLNPELPRRLKAVRMSPGRLQARLEELAKARLPVVIVLAGQPAIGYRTETTITPDQVEVTGPASTVKTLGSVSTRRVDISGVSTPFERNVLLEPAGDFVAVVPDRVRVAVQFPEKVKTQEFARVRVALRNGDAARITPADVSLKVEGPELAFKDWSPEGAVFVDAEGLEAGTHQLPVQVDLPAPLVVKERRPDSVRVLVTAGDKNQGGA